MKLFRVVRRGHYISYAIVGNDVIRLDEDPVQALIRYYENKEVLGDKVVGIDYDLLLKNFQVGDMRITKPFDPIEVWGAGMSYETSRDRYAGEDSKSVYERAYELPRPELFFKATSNRCVGHGEAIVIRSDSDWTVPEPELAVVLDSNGRILGYTIMDDVSAKDISALHPLYSPQAKIYVGSCAFGPFIVTPDEIPNHYNLDITLRILRNGVTFYESSVNTNKMRRKIETQIEYLIRDNSIPDGTILTTGTGISLTRDRKLEEGDVVEISITNLGTLITPVTKRKYPLSEKVKL